MSYQAFALKYRPKTFADVVGQTHVVTALKTAVEKAHIHHAYLFSGPRGCGKTSMARILAKSLNCVNGPTVTPCGKCSNCLEIAKGISLDVIEIDGASNRGIDDIRALRESVKLAPIGALYKVYIIDEVHQITSDGFNALLKTLEEPPAHVKFIFATTHPQKIIPTILSRCQKFQFTLFLLEEVVTKLRSIAKQEKLKIDDSVLYAIARSSGGSMRDAESLLDQLAPVISQGELVDDIFSFLGIIDEDTLLKILTLTITKQLPQLLAFFGARVQEGKDLGTLLNGLIEYLRVLLLAKVSNAAFKLVTDISPAGKKIIAELAAKVSSAETLRAIDLLIDAKAISKQLNTVRIPFELALIKFTRREEVDYSNNKYQPKDFSAACPPVDNQPLPQARTVMPVAPMPVKSVKLPAKRNVNPPKNNNCSAIRQAIDDAININFSDLDLEAEPIKQTVKMADSGQVTNENMVRDNMVLNVFMAKWQQMLLAMQRERVSIATHLALAKPMSSTGKVITIAFPEKESFHKEILEMPKNTEYIEKFITKILKKEIAIKFVTIKSDVSMPAMPADTGGPTVPEEALVDKPAIDNQVEETDTVITMTKTEKTAKDKADDNEFINDLLDTFGGSIHVDD